MKTITRAEKNEVTLNPGRRFYVILFVVAFTIIVLRRPDAILNPQFWAEDGKVFYADAYNKGLFVPILSPHGGYLDILPRLVAALSQPFPLYLAPLIFNIAAIFLKTLPVIFLLSSRISAVIPDVRIRAFLAFLYLALPNSWEVNASLVSTKNHLALLSFMVLSAGAGINPLWRFFDVGIILLSGLSGPFSIALFPISALFCFIRRDRMSFILLILIGLCAFIQCAFLLNTAARPPRLLGATPDLFFRILTSQVFMGATIGQRGLSLISHSGLFNVIVLFLAIGGLTVLMNALLKAPAELRIFIFLAFILFCAALSSPLVNLTDPQWPLMLIPGVGGRYWFISMLALVSVLVWSLRRSSSRLSKTFAAAAFSIMLIGIVLDWRHPAFRDFNFKEHALRCESAPVGSRIEIPINPEPWKMVLVKRP